MELRPSENTPRRLESFALTFTYAWIAGIFALSSSPLAHLWRPLVAGLTFTLLVMLVAIAAARGSRRSQLVAGTLALVSLAAWPLVAAIAAASAWAYGVDALRRRQGRKALGATPAASVLRIANGFGWIVAAVVTVNMVASGGLDIVISPEPAAGSVSVRDEPSIYVVLLDGYPRADTLEDAFGYDNEAFLADLTARGFDVAAESRSNYARTLMTLASMLNMEYTATIAELSPVRDTSAGQDRQLSAAINTSAGVEMLRQHGYHIAASGSPFGVASLMHADTYFESGGITRFEEQLARITWLATALEFVGSDFIGEQARASVHDAFDDWRSVAESRRDGPTFMLTHVLTPHSPFLFAADGSSLPMPDCFPSQCSLWESERQRNGLTLGQYKEGLAGQIEYVNGLILDTIDGVVAADPDAVIILLSDHGIRYDTGDRAEYFRNFFAARTPGGNDVFPPGTSPVNTLPLLFNEYLGTDLPIRPYEAWWSEEGLLDVERYEPQP
ncbi:MAG: hypothetical protein ACRDG7_16290 [Candidatus Limnocylindria bacterium]